jgi:hypothetical protein
MKMDPTWSSTFNRLVKLERLLWYVPEDNYDDILGIDGALKARVRFYKYSKEHLKLRTKLNSDAEQQYVAAFDEVPEPPLIRFRIMLWQTICECGAHPDLYDESMYFKDHIGDDENDCSLNDKIGPV